MSDKVGRRRVVASNRAAWWPVAGCFGLVAACNKNKHSPIFLRAPGSLLVCPRRSVLFMTCYVSVAMWVRVFS